MATRVDRRIRQGLADLFSFVRSREANQAIAAVTHEQLIQEQVARNGETDRSRSSSFDPYGFDPNKVEPAGVQPLSRSNFVSGTDVNLPTKMDQILAMKNVLDSLIRDLKEIPPDQIVDPQAELSAAQRDTIFADSETEIRGEKEVV